MDQAKCVYCGGAIQIDEPMGDYETLDMECPHCQKPIHIVAMLLTLYRVEPIES